MGRIIDSLNNKMPQLINKTGKEYKAIFGKTDYTGNIPIEKSSDYNCGAIANELEYLRSFLDFVIECFNVENAEKDYLEKIIWFFLKLGRIWDESDANLKNRFFSIIRRNSNPRWDTSWSLKDLFSYFFDKKNIIIEENYIEVSLVQNGGFEEGAGNDFTNWTKTEEGSSLIIENVTDPFAGSRCAQFQIDSSNSLARLEQVFLSVPAGNYKICFFFKDDGNCLSNEPIRIYVKRSGDNYYYNFETNSWQVEAVYKKFSKSGSDYVYCQAYINNADLRDLTLGIENDGAPGQAYNFQIDRVMFGTWEDYPSVKVLIIFGPQGGGYTSLWDGTDDPLGGVEDYQFAGYFDQDFIGGEGGGYTSDFYQNILDRVKVAGVKGTLETISRAVI